MRLLAKTDPPTAGVVNVSCVIQLRNTNSVLYSGVCLILTEFGNMSNKDVTQAYVNCLCILMTLDHLCSRHHPSHQTLELLFLSLSLSHSSTSASMHCIKLATLSI